MNRTNIIGILLLLVALSAGIMYAGTSGPSPIPPPPNFQISTNMITLCKGIINNVPISIKTPQGADEMQDVQLSITNSRYAYTVGNGTVSAINVSANKTKVVVLPIFVSLNSSSLISTGIAINYQYDTLYSDSEVRNISFGIETCASPLSVKVSPYVLTSGKIENVTFNLTNAGNTTLNYLSIHTALPSTDGTFLGIQPVQIASIQPHDSVSLNESVFVYQNATQSFPINLTISMYNGTSLQQISDNPIVLSSGIINITPSSITLSPTNPTPGSIFSIAFVLTDVGTSKASAVTATPLPIQGFSSYGSNSVFVGDMQVDTQIPVTITLITSGTLHNGTYTIPVRINYLNNLRQNLSTIVDVPVMMRSGAPGLNTSGGVTIKRTSAKGSGSGLIELILVIVIIVLLALYYTQNKKHKAAMKR
ncbi:MAG: hypothetical protein ACREBH_02185 [Candidatus Micrarchaeaceae archaeon]